MQDDAEDLRADVSRGAHLDRDLARDIGRPVPDRTASTAAYLEALVRAPSETPASDLVTAAQAGDADARARLVEASMPLVASVASAYRTGHVQRQELLQEGVVGVLRALERYDPGRDVPFWAYATWWVRQAMQQLVAELTRPVVLSDRALRQLARLKDAHQTAVQEGGTEPGRAELAERSGMTLDQVDGLLATEGPARSLEEPVVGQDGSVGTFGDLLADPLAETEYERVLAAIEVEELQTLLAGLSDREREVLRARFGFDGEERSRREIGEAIGLSGERVRQIESRALGKLAAGMTGE